MVAYDRYGVIILNLVGGFVKLLTRAITRRSCFRASNQTKLHGLLILVQPIIIIIIISMRFIFTFFVIDLFCGKFFSFCMHQFHNKKFISIFFLKAYNFL